MASSPRSARWMPRARVRQLRRKLLDRHAFAAIEAAGGDRRKKGHVLKWPEKIRIQLNKRLSSHCDQAMRAHQALIDGRTSFPPPPIDKRTARKVEAAISVLDDARLHLEEGANELVNFRWQRFYKALDDIRPLARPRRRRPGPKSEIWLDDFIAIVADAYSAVGGDVSAQRKSKAETPFLRVLRLVYQSLPHQLRRIGLPALDKRARQTGIQVWKEYRANNASFLS